MVMKDFKLQLHSMYTITTSSFLYSFPLSLKWKMFCFLKSHHNFVSWLCKFHQMFRTFDMPSVFIFWCSISFYLGGGPLWSYLICLNLNWLPSKLALFFWGISTITVGISFMFFGLVSLLPEFLCFFFIGLFLDFGIVLIFRLFHFYLPNSLLGCALSSF